MTYSLIKNCLDKGKTIILDEESVESFKKLVQKWIRVFGVEDAP